MGLSVAEEKPDLFAGLGSDSSRRMARSRDAFENKISYETSIGSLSGLHFASRLAGERRNSAS
jgi:hypothetical protein